MKAIVCKERNQLKAVELPEPVLAPGSAEAIVSIRRIGICGTDLHAYRGNQPFFTYPRVLGHELSGIVEQVGDQVRGLRPGDQVAVIPYLECGACIACRNGKTNCCTNMQVLGVHTDGGMRERIAVPADHLLVTDGLTLDQAAILEPLSIGAHAVRRSGLRQGETVLVIGAGPIGLGVMLLAKRAGARVIAMDIHDERLDFCGRWARTDHTMNGLHSPVEQLEALTGGELPTVVFDATGNARSMTTAFSYAAHGGRLVYVGLVKADITFSDPDFHKRELTLLGSRNATREDFEQVMAAFREGLVDAEAFITHRAPFDEVIERFEDWLKPESKVIKAVVELE
ncbi:zinc-binding alcohol dehydrogenase family protein [Paenibacillus puerhi]|uniref:zinc-binding alcohol dehydrogenase family protein n=1 Tax=Paenibacillus puerhi TaxID=2692622 RepID=UPI00135A2410|nr:zinc-binding alcohol dehydrogenase family protein [Paenibacillus puerhi]